MKAPHNASNPPEMVARAAEQHQAGVLATRVVELSADQMDRLMADMAYKWLRWRRRIRPCRFGCGQPSLPYNHNKCGECR